MIDVFSYSPYRTYVVAPVHHSVQLKQRGMRKVFDDQHPDSPFLNYTTACGTLTFTRPGNFIISVIELGVCPLYNRTHNVVVIVSVY